MKSGIYEIVNLANNKKYIGSSKHLSKRKKEHFNQLRNGNHYNKHLQRAWNKYGEKNFVFNIIEYVYESTELLDREQFYIDLYDVSNISKGYNILPNSSSMLGFNHSEETRKKFSKDRMGDKNNFFGKRHSDKTKKIISQYRSGENNLNSKLTENDVLNIYKLLEEKILGIAEIAQLYNVKGNTISQIKSGIHWKHLYHHYKNKDDINRNQKLTEVEVLEIYKLLQDNLSYPKIAKKYNVCNQTICNIKNGFTYKHLYHFYNDNNIKIS